METCKRCNTEKRLIEGMDICKICFEEILSTVYFKALMSKNEILTTPEKIMNTIRMLKELKDIKNEAYYRVVHDVHEKNFRNEEKKINQEYRGIKNERK